MCALGFCHHVFSLGRRGKSLAKVLSPSSPTHYTTYYSVNMRFRHARNAVKIIPGHKLLRLAQKNGLKKKRTSKFLAQTVTAKTPHLPPPPSPFSPLAWEVIFIMNPSSSSSAVAVASCVSENRAFSGGGKEERRWLKYDDDFGVGREMGCCIHARFKKRLATHTSLYLKNTFG